MKSTIKLKTIIFSIFAFVIGIVSGFGSYTVAFSPESDTLFSSIVSGDLSIHFLELGNQYAGDCIYIKANGNDILIDAGSRQKSAKTIINYVNNYCTDNTLEYLVSTHAHQDHIAAMSSTATQKGIFASYKVENIIDFGTATKYEKGATPTQTYLKYVQERTDEIAQGANYIKVSDFQQASFNPIINLGNGISIEFLNNFYYYNTTSNENNYSVCLLVKQGSVNVLLTGDLEAEGETKLVELNPNLPQCTLFKAAHHGSYTGSTEVLMNKIKPQNVVFTCVAGSTEYTEVQNNTFPSQNAINSIAKYTQNCFVTTYCYDNTDYSKFASLNGDVIFTSNKSGYSITGTNNNTILKDTTWFKANRTWPNVA